jgi:hypothetical protein
MACIFAARGLTGLWSHALYTAIAGAGFGYFLGATDRPMGRRVTVAVALYLLATVVHSTLDAVLAIGALGVLATVISGTIGGIVAWRFADRRQRTWIRALLDGELAAGIISAEELSVLAGPRKDRRRYLRSVKSARGRAAARQAGHVLDAQIDWPPRSRPPATSRGRRPRPPGPRSAGFAPSRPSDPAGQGGAADVGGQPDAAPEVALGAPVLPYGVTPPTASVSAATRAATGAAGPAGPRRGSSALPPYSTSSSVRRSRDGGIVTPSVAAVLRLTAR